MLYNTSKHIRQAKRKIKTKRMNIAINKIILAQK